MTHPVIINSNFSSPLLSVINEIAYSSIVIVTDSNVGPLHAQKVMEVLAKKGGNSHLLTVKAGESSKSRDTKAWLEDAMADLGCGRDTLLIGLGGGMITDLAGFVAATYCRGIPFIGLPTSLMGMVDASLGGKNGINTLHGKNTIGTIRPPHAVIINPSFLDTLPFNDYHMALSEVVKHALIADQELFDFLQENTSTILAKDKTCITAMIERSVAIKMDVVNADALELNHREILNFGHTIGHAIEHASNYTISHGEAVAHGLLYESRLSYAMGHLSQHALDAIESLLSELRLLKGNIALSSTNILEALQHDKKKRGDSIRCVLLASIAKPLIINNSYAQAISVEQFTQAL